MNTRSIVVSLVCLITIASSPAKAEGITTVPGPTPSANVPAGYHLAFSDNFATADVNVGNPAIYDGVNKWYAATKQCCVTPHPFIPGWMYPASVYGGPFDSQVANPFSVDPSGAGLDITMSYYPNLNCPYSICGGPSANVPHSGVIYSGMASSVDSAGNPATGSWQYGYVEIKATMPLGGNGQYPALWMLSVPGAPCNGEIDIIEAYGQFPAYYQTTLHNWSAGTGIQNKSQVNTQNNGVFDGKPHLYGMLWTAQRMTFYFDEQVLWTTPTPSCMVGEKYFFVFSNGLGAGWPAGPGITTIPNTMKIEYVQVWQP